MDPVPTFTTLPVKEKQLSKTCATMYLFLSLVVVDLLFSSKAACRTVYNFRCYKVEHYDPVSLMNLIRADAYIFRYICNLPRKTEQNGSMGGA